MKNNNKLRPSAKKLTTAFRLFNEKTLPVVFAGLSLAFVLFYTFGQNTTHAGGADVALTESVTSDEKSALTDSSSETSVAPSTAADVVTKALAFKASLTAAQQTTLEKTYTAALARKWSNLPCGANCRNGIQFSTLTAAQLTAALQVIQAAAGTTTNEGYSEFLQIRAAEEILQAQAGGNNYDEGNYWISFLNTPTTTGAWMLQYSGHHYAANIAYNGGHVVATTPLFEGVEPISFTYNGTAYAPLAQEHDALANMLASLSAAQLTTAKLSSTFSDVTLAPGETNGGSGTFPTTKVGIAVSTLSDVQKLLVLEAMKPWVRDMDDTVAANLLTIYQNELAGTYIAYTGNGTSGSPSTFLNANTNYARIDGPSVWIEFVCQNGVVFSGIHYHSVWRDHVRDYGADLTLTTPLDSTPTTTSSTAFDYDGDGKADVSVYRPSAGSWYISNSSNSAFVAQQFGVSSDLIAPADFDGDGKTDISVFRPTDGTWYRLNSSTSALTAVQFGASGDLPTPGDFDGDLKADICVYRPSAGSWYRINSSTSTFVAAQFGIAEDKPLVGDFDGDDKSDLAVFRPSNGTGIALTAAPARFRQLNSALQRINQWRRTMTATTLLI
jgi:hypothetical protein